MTAPPLARVDVVSPPEAARRGRVPRHRVAVRLLLAALAGVVLLLAFPSYDLWFLAPVGVALLDLACRGARWRTGLLAGFITGLAFFVPLLSWSGVYVGPVPWLLLALSQAVIFAPLGVGLALLTRLPGRPVWAAGLWVAEEAVRGRVPFGGFPWGRLAFSQPDTPFTAWAAVGGAPLVSFMVALTGGLLALAGVAAVRAVAWRPVDLRHRSGPAQGRRALHAATGLLGAVALSVAGLLVPASVPTDGSAAIAVVQGNVPRLGLDFNAQRQAVLRNHVDATLRLAADVRAGRTPAPRLVIWPENSSDVNPFTDPSAAALIDEAARAVGVPILVGAMRAGPRPDTRYNTGVVWDPVTGPGATYDKRHPVPFGEYIPLRALARKVSDKVDLVPSDMAAGDRVGALDVAGIRVGDAICFEVAYDGLVRDTVNAGARMIVIQTNNATFGRTAETTQQLAMGRLRAIEHGRTVVVSSTSGISAVITPDGTITRQAGIFEQAVLTAQVPLASARTLADRIGGAGEWVLVGLGGVGLLAVAIRRRWT